ncbi:hypothetical protein GLOIN_2v1771106 [Rhizophagus clarus]|uniref:Uncharacterized protein n=1 Tax=Rhizophagus clarus TaxID=94130 RepID=A0A8H3QEP0_9GLOM|nr:hypothetical protein GLOIN_2v1771106 [Rhizophagus clarus]
MATSFHIPIDNTPNKPYKGSAIVRLYKPATIFPISFLIHHLRPYLSCDTREAGTLYNTKKARYYLLSLGLSTLFGPETNNFMEKLYSIKQRIDSDNHNYHYTKTYIWFSSGNHMIYLGFHLRCGEHYNEINTCHHTNRYIPRDKKYYADELKHHAQTKEVKHVHSNRLGITYDVIIKSVRGAPDFDIVRSPQQIQHFKRLSTFILKQNVDCAIKKPFLLQVTTDRDKKPVTILKQIHHCPRKQQPSQFYIQDITNRFNIDLDDDLTFIIFQEGSALLASPDVFLHHIHGPLTPPPDRHLNRRYSHDSAATIMPADVNCVSASQPLAHVNFTPESSYSPRTPLPDNFTHRSSSDDVNFFDV